MTKLRLKQISISNVLIVLDMLAKSPINSNNGILKTTSSIKYEIGTRESEVFNVSSNKHSVLAEDTTCSYSGYNIELSFPESSGTLHHICILELEFDSGVTRT